MRTIIELPDDQIAALADACEREHISRAEAIRRAVASWLERSSQDDFDAAFGSWRDLDMDSVDYVRKLRAEWDR